MAAAQTLPLPLEPVEPSRWASPHRAPHPNKRALLPPQAKEAKALQAQRARKASKLATAGAVSVQEGGERGGGEGGASTSGEGEGKLSAGGEVLAEPPRVAEKVLESNDEPGAAARWLVKWAGMAKEKASWLDDH